MQMTKFIGGILLVSGTTIGAGMLALPVATGIAGFLPSIVLLFFCWFFMLYTAFLMLEATLWIKEEINLVTIAKQTLGFWGELFCWTAYLFLLYALMTAYVAGTGMIMSGSLHELTGIAIPQKFHTVPLILLFSLFVYKGTVYVDRINRWLMIGLVATYFALVTFSTPYIDIEKLSYSNWSKIELGLSLVITSFGFHIIIPSLSAYLKRDITALKWTLLIGSAIPLVVYLIWEIIGLGIIPVEGPNGLLEGYASGIDGSTLLNSHINVPYLGLIVRLFSFFAILTSFLGVSLSLSDFLADGLKVKKTPLGKGLLYGLTFLPPLIFTMINPRIFFTALEYAGAYGVISLLCLLPALMVWRGRYYLHLNSGYRTPGGKVGLLLVIFISLMIISLKIVSSTK